ncbi:MAG: SDR family NAD(P)-dependent oxidoreductase [Pseudomonadota bacterium]
MGRLDQTVSVVTGGGTGIGRHIALAQAAEGAKVAVIGRRASLLAETVFEITEASGKAKAFPADLTQPDSAAAAFSEIADNLGGIDTLFNNAGAVLPEMIARGSGRVVNMIGGGTAAPLPVGSGYSVSKTAVMRLTECLAATLEGTGIVCLAMAPGLVRTDMTEYQISSEAGQRYMPGLAKRFQNGDNLPPTRAAELAVAIAAGQFDRLTGRAVSATEDIDAITAAIPDIIELDMRTLRLSGFGPTMKPVPN